MNMDYCRVLPFYLSDSDDDTAVCKEEAIQKEEKTGKKGKQNSTDKKEEIVKDVKVIVRIFVLC